MESRGRWRGLVAYYVQSLVLCAVLLAGLQLALPPHHIQWAADLRRVALLAVVLPMVWAAAYLYHRGRRRAR